MRKYILIIIGITIVGVLLALLFGGKPQDAGLAGTNNVPAPQILPGEQLNVPTGDTLVLGTSRGSVAVKNFYKTAEEIIEQTEVVIRQTNDYIIVYHASNSSFTIIVRGRPLATARRSAEDMFLAVLGIPQSSACDLSIRVSLPYDADDAFRGGDYPLSFCPKSL